MGPDSSHGGRAFKRRDAQAHADSCRADQTTTYECTRTWAFKRRNPARQLVGVYKNASSRKRGSRLRPLHRTLEIRSGYYRNCTHLMVFIKTKNAALPPTGTTVSAAPGQSANESNLSFASADISTSGGICHRQKHDGGHVTP